MRSFQLLISTFCLFASTSSHSTTSIEQKKEFRQLNSSDSELIFAHVIYRHGDRNIYKVYKNDPYKDEIHWQNGIGQLTNEGKRQQYKLGQYFRRRYTKLIGDKYSADKVYIRSTDFDRTIMSAQCNAAGMFPPTGDEIWNEQLLWNPIPVHTVPIKSDYVLVGPKNCPKFDVNLQKYIKESSEVQEILTKHRNLFLYWSKMCGSDLKTINDVSMLHNTLYIENLHNKSLAAWAQRAIEPNGILENIAKFCYQMGAATPQLARVQSGFLIKEMLERFTQKINSTLSPNRSLWLYSAHDLTISYKLKTLGLFELHIPRYACSLHFELYKTNRNEHYFQLFYRNAEEEHLSPLNIPKCGEKCSIDRFYTEYSDIIPGDRDSECNL